MKFSFIHTADIHLGRAFADIDYELSPEQKNIINTAHEEALGELCDFAIDKEVDFVLIAGDTFDDCEHDLHSRLVLYNFLKRLETNEIGVYIVPGNHDPENSYTKELGFKTSEYVKIFGVNIPSKTLVIKNRAGEEAAVIYPFGFKTTEYPASPCRVLEKAKSKDLFNIGLIHCDRSGGDKNVYAPCSEKELLDLGYDYYALGHIHKPDLGEKIVYPGTIQARSRKDTGEHGFCYVNVDNNSIVSNEFVKCDKVRYYNLTVSVTGDETEIETIEKIQLQIGELSRGVKLVIINLTLEGVCGYKKPENNILKTELSNAGVIISGVENNSVIDMDVDLIKSSGGVLAQILSAADNDIQMIAEQTDRDLSDILKLVPEFDRNVPAPEAAEIVQNICKEIYGGEEPDDE